MDGVFPPLLSGGGHIPFWPCAGGGFWTCTCLCMRVHTCARAWRCTCVQRVCFSWHLHVHTCGHESPVHTCAHPARPCTCARVCPVCLRVPRACTCVLACTRGYALPKPPSFPFPLALPRGRGDHRADVAGKDPPGCPPSSRAGPSPQLLAGVPRGPGALRHGSGSERREATMGVTSPPPRCLRRRLRQASRWAERRAAPRGRGRPPCLPQAPPAR